MPRRPTFPPPRTNLLYQPTVQFEIRYTLLFQTADQTTKFGSLQQIWLATQNSTEE